MREFAEKRSCLLTAARHLLVIFPLCMELFKGAVSLSLFFVTVGAQREYSSVSAFLCVCVYVPLSVTISALTSLYCYICVVLFFFFKIVYLNVPFFFSCLFLVFNGEASFSASVVFVIFRSILSIDLFVFVAVAGVCVLPSPLPLSENGRINCRCGLKKGG